MFRRKTSGHTSSRNIDSRHKRFRRQYFERLEDRLAFNCANLWSSIQLEITNTSGTAVTFVDVGKTFEVRASVPADVFAAYMDVTYPADAAVTAGPIRRSKYDHGTNLNQLSAGLLNDIGGFLGAEDLIPPNGGGLLFSVPFQATKAGTIKFTGRAPGRAPFTDLSVFNCDNSVPPNHVNWGEASVVVNGVPVLNNPGTKTIDEKKTLAFTLSATDSDVVNNVPDSVTYSIASGSLPGMKLIGTSGAFSWTPTESQDGDSVVVFRATDNHGAFSDETVTLSVKEVNEPPTLVNPGNKSVNEKSELRFLLQFTDPDIVKGVPETSTFAIVGGNVTGMSVNNSNGNFSWTPTESQDGKFVVIFRATDAHGAAAPDQAMTVTVNDVNEPPVSNGPANRTVNELQSLTFSLTVSDSDVTAGAPDAVSLSMVSGQKPGMNFNASSGFFSWSPTESQDGQHVVVFRATDRHSAAIEITNTITVNEVNTPPVLIHPSDKMVNEKSELSFALVATDSDVVGGVTETISYSIVSGSQPGMTLDPKTGIVRWSPTENQDGQFSVTFRARDQHDLASRDQSITITVNELNEPPSLTNPSNQSVDELHELTFKLGVSDSDVIAGVPDPLSYLFVSGNQPGMTLDSSGTFHWTPTETQDGRYVVVFRAQDKAGLASADQPVTITVRDVNEAPTDISLSNTDIDENLPGGIIGDVVVHDLDLADSHTFTVSNDLFEIVGGKFKLKAGGSVDFETAELHEVAITAIDSGSPPLRVTKSFTISVRDGNDPPGEIVLPNSTVKENVSGVVIGELIASDPDAGQVVSFRTIDPRFVILGSTLKMTEGNYADLEQEAIIAVNITAIDSGNPSRERSQTLQIEVVANPRAWRNDARPFDTNADGRVTPQDALRIINQLNDPSALGLGGRLAEVRAADSPLAYFDTNGDGHCTPIDVLGVVNFLNLEGESEATFALPILPPNDDGIRTVDGNGESSRPQRADRLRLHEQGVVRRENDPCDLPNSRDLPSQSRTVLAEEMTCELDDVYDLLVQDFAILNGPHAALHK